MKLKPEVTLKTLWYLTWAVLFFPGIMLLIILYFFVDKLIIGICFSCWVLVFIPILFWIPKAYWIVEYHIDDDSIKMQAGVVWKKNVTVPYAKINNIDITSGPIQRKFKVGTVHVQTAGYGGQQGQKAELKINGVKETEKIRDIIIENIRHYSKSYEKITLATAKVGEVQTDDRDNATVLNNILNELINISRKLDK